MKSPFTWDEIKRQKNLAKHGLDFVDAGEVLDSKYRLDIPIIREGEARIQAISYALGFLAVLTVVHTERDGATRIISLPPGKQQRKRGVRCLARKRIR